MDGLSIERLGAGYGRTPVLQDIDLAGLRRGTLTALVGPNAAGKSTLLKALAGLRPYSGRVAIDGDAMEGRSGMERARRFAYLPQTPPVAAALTVYESILCARRATGLPDASDTEATTGAVEALGIGDVAFRHLDELSGGQRQLVGIAQVLVRSPDVLLLDEPTSALDLNRQLRVLEVVREAATARSLVVLLAMHDLNLAVRFSDRVVVLSRGRVAASGPPLTAIDNELLASVYGVEARVERCSIGHPVVLVDRAAAAVAGAPVP